MCQHVYGELLLTAVSSSPLMRGGWHPNIIAQEDARRRVACGVVRHYTLADGEVVPRLRVDHRVPFNQDVRNRARHAPVAVVNDMPR